MGVQFVGRAPADFGVVRAADFSHLEREFTMRTTPRRHGRWIGIALLMVGCVAARWPAYGWGQEGHDIVAAIAALRLNDDARAALVEILGTDDIASRGIPNWADAIKPSHRETAP